MSMEMDWVWEPGTLAFRERLTGLLDCAETLIHRPRRDRAFPLWFQPGPQAPPCYTLCPESFQAISSDSEFSFVQQHFLRRDHVLLIYKLLSLLSAGPCDKNSLCVFCFYFNFFFFCPSWFWKDLPLWKHVEECGVQEGTGEIVRLQLYQPIYSSPLPPLQHSVHFFSLPWYLRLCIAWRLEKGIPLESQEAVPENNWFLAVSIPSLLHLSKNLQLIWKQNLPGGLWDALLKVLLFWVFFP